MSLLAGVLPPGRMNHFLRLAGHDDVRAYRLHEWNEEIGSAFFGLLQKAELALRVRVTSAFTAVYGSSWFDDPGFLTDSSFADRNSIAEARRRLIREHQPVDAEGIMSKASFGLWVGLMRPTYNITVWSNQIKTVFPDLPPSVKRHDLATLASRAARLRNRIDHHEPLVELDVSLECADLILLLGWIDPRLAARAQATCRIPQLMRAKP